jgi:hypothetical protein
MQNAASGDEASDAIESNSDDRDDADGVKSVHDADELVVNDAVASATAHNGTVAHTSESAFVTPPPIVRRLERVFVM